MKKRYILVATFALIAITSIFILNMSKSYSYGLTYEITGTKGNRKITFYDEDTNKQISLDSAINNYGISAYLSLYDDGDVYFYRGQETNKDTYIKGVEAEKADKLAKSYGASAYRVKTTDQFKKAFDDIFKNYKIGEYFFFFSKYENIDFNSVEKYYMTNYGLLNSKQDYYTYKLKGPQEPTRFPLNLSASKNQGYFRMTTYDIRISKNEMQVAENFVNKLLPLMKGDGSDYQKILAAYTYIVNTTSYLVDNGFVNDLLASNTSIYDVFINRKSVCIGYSIAFSYLMDKMGIESYIVDDITSVNDTNKTANSSHTFNIVKLDGKFYRIDLTGKQFLTGMRSLYDKKLNISSSAYNKSGKPTTYSFDYSKINSYLNDAKTMKTTTTKRQELKIQSTKAQAPLNMRTPNQGNNNNNPGATNGTPGKTTTTIDDVTKHSNTVVTSNGGSTTHYTNPSVTENVNPTNTGNNTSNAITNNTNANNQTPAKKNNSDGINLNYIFAAMIVFVILIFILYKIKEKQKTSYDDNITDILNKYRK